MSEYVRGLEDAAEIAYSLGCKSKCGKVISSSIRALIPSSEVEEQKESVTPPPPSASKPETKKSGE